MNEHPSLSPTPARRARRARGGIAASLVAGLLAGSLAGGAAGGALGVAFQGTASSPSPAQPAGSSSTTTLAAATDAERDVSDIVAAAQDAVVTIEVSAQGRGGLTATGSGSGFVVSPDGLILTSYHVIDGAARISALLTDGSSYQASVVATNSSRDVALLRIEATGLPTLTLATGTLEVGQAVVSMGTALGEYPNTVTLGVVSGLDREMTASTGFRTSETLSGVIQTDAALSSGMSGGPLLDSAGRVVGINTAVYGDANGIGFAVPIADGAALLAGLTAA